MYSIDDYSNSVSSGLYAYCSTPTPKLFFSPRPDHFFLQPRVCTSTRSRPTCCRHPKTTQRPGRGLQQQTSATEPAQPRAQSGFGQGQAAEQKNRCAGNRQQGGHPASCFYGTINEIYVKEGEHFKAGQPPISFDCRELAAEHAVAQAELSCTAPQTRPTPNPTPKR